MEKLSSGIFLRGAGMIEESVCHGQMVMNYNLAEKEETMNVAMKSLVYLSQDTLNMLFNVN